MSDIAARYRTVAAQFAERVRAVPDAAWSNPAPCEGWLARDVVRHLVDWVPSFLRSGADVELPAGLPVDEDPLGAWTAMSDGIQALLDDVDAAAREFAHPRAGRHRLDEAIGTFILSDVLVHTWDLARATGLDERLDPAEVHRMLVGLEPMADVLSQSGQYGPRVPVADDADEQTRLLAVTGRRAR